MPPLWGEPDRRGLLTESVSRDGGLPPRAGSGDLDIRRPEDVRAHQLEQRARRARRYAAAARARTGGGGARRGGKAEGGFFGLGGAPLFLAPGPAPPRRAARG